MQERASGARVIDGKAVAASVIERVKAARDRLMSELGVKPGLAVVLVGTDPASAVYVRNKSRTAEECGFHSEQHTLPAETDEAELLRLVERLNADPAIHGILVQLPLPKHIESSKVLIAIDPDKDVDGFHPVNVGRLASGALNEALVPCTPAGSVILVKRALGNDLSGREAVVVGRSNIVGKPVAQLLLAENCTVTICHSRTRDLPAVCRRGDILIAAVGRPEMVKGDWVKPGATVIDVGINRVAAPEKGEGKMKLVGDVDYAAAARVAGAITPVPGGVGPMTIAMLMANTVTAAARKAGRGDIAKALSRGESTAEFVVEFGRKPSAEASDDRLDAPAFHRNIEPMLEVLRRLLRDRPGHSLEVGSGTGQHVVRFAEALPRLTWWPSDPNPNHRKSIEAWSRQSGLTNIAPPFALDAADPKIRLAAPISKALAAVVSMNVVHIAPWSVCEGIMRLAGDHLMTGGLLVLYGPFKRRGGHTSPSNERFDASLRRENPEWGVRDVQEVEAAAAVQGLRLTEVVEMPANNLTLVIERKSRGS